MTNIFITLKNKFYSFSKASLCFFYTPDMILVDLKTKKHDKNILPRLKIDTPLINKQGIPGVQIVASYTEADKDYLPGFIDSCNAFEKIILYHDKNINHNFEYNESHRFQALIQIAKKNGAKWVLIASPKTRFSTNFKDQVLPYIDHYNGSKTVLSIKERYLWGDFEHYAYVKSVGDNVRIQKFFTVTNCMVFDNKALHATQYPINYTNIINIDACRYYLGRFNISIMQKKADFYHNKDGKDYSFLCDMSDPIKHDEKISGIGQYERMQLIE